MLIDTHVHLDDEQFRGRLPDVVQRARAADVAAMIAVGTTLVSSQYCVSLANQYADVYAAVGIHPNHSHEAGAADWEQIVTLTRDRRVVAVGETGLDRYWDNAPFAVQRQFFERHMNLAKEIDRPFIVHMRDCEADMVDMLRTARRQSDLKGVMHAYSGSLETARVCVDLGLHISFAGMVTYRKSDELRAVAAAIPADRLLLETDGPYLSPHPCRGQRPNEPALMIHTAACLAGVRGVDIETLAEQTTANARRLFGLSE